jgi:hypothetical protein
MCETVRIHNHCPNIGCKGSTIMHTRYCVKGKKNKLCTSHRYRTMAGSPKECVSHRQQKFEGQSGRGNPKWWD